MTTTPSNGHATTSARRPKAPKAVTPLTLERLADDLDLHTLELSALVRVQHGVRYQDLPMPPEDAGWLGALIQTRLGELAAELRRDAQACLRHAKG